jgi:hypothetical protein
MFFRPMRFGMLTQNLLQIVAKEKVSRAFNIVDLPLTEPFGSLFDGNEEFQAQGNFVK